DKYFGCQRLYEFSELRVTYTHVGRGLYSLTCAIKRFEFLLFKGARAAARRDAQYHERDNGCVRNPKRYASLHACSAVAAGKAYETPNVASRKVWYRALRWTGRRGFDAVCGVWWNRSTDRLTDSTWKPISRKVISRRFFEGRAVRSS